MASLAQYSVWQQASPNVKCTDAQTNTCSLEHPTPNAIVEIVVKFTGHAGSNCFIATLNFVWQSGLKCGCRCSKNLRICERMILSSARLLLMSWSLSLLSKRASTEFRMVMQRLRSKPSGLWDGVSCVFGDSVTQDGDPLDVASICQHRDCILAADCCYRHNSCAKPGCHADKLLPLRPEDLVLLPFILVCLHPRAFRTASMNACFARVSSSMHLP